MVPPASNRVSRAPPYSRNIQSSPTYFTYRAITVSGAAFQPTSTIDEVFDSTHANQCATNIRTTPDYATPDRLHVTGLGFSRFARHYYGNLG